MKTWVAISPKVISTYYMPDEVADLLQTMSGNWPFQGRQSGKFTIERGLKALALAADVMENKELAEKLAEVRVSSRANTQ
jgi:hypothetical protein